MTDKVKKVMKASFWMLTVSWYSKILSMFTVIILARNLTKYDFGILAGCFVARAFFNAISNVGSENYLIRKKNISNDQINTAWTISIFSKFLVGCMIFLLSDLVANFMKIPELSLVLKVMCLSTIFRSFQSPALTINMKKLEYKKIAFLEACAKSFSSTISIVIVVLYQTYWGVIVAEVLFSFVYALGSQFIVKHKLKLSLIGLSEQWTFSKWILLKGIVSYTKSGFDRIMVSRSYSIGELGLYNFALESSITALQFIIDPVKNLINPSLSDYIYDSKVFADKIHKSLLVLSIIYMPVVVGGVTLSDLIVPIVFGEKWNDAIPFFDLFLSMTFVGMLISVLTDIFTLTGRVKLQFYFELVTSFIVVLLLMNAISLELEMFALYRALIPCLMLFLLLFTLKYCVDLSIFRLFILYIPLLISSLIMLLNVSWVATYLFEDVSIFSLFILILIGAITYVFTMLLMIYLLKFKVKEYDFLYSSFVLPIMNLIKIKNLQ
ncbi:oligosaccharide flippase family protein [Vibrio sp. TH_r3]|uniref:oligosaccharide flippase family protein n=1 Tax=Vibrio sp. TH_r3 TaxID=3082084 RepID=UPI002954B107|nr:oligosaccharide flippase family protein [Vibrio sp. TH_r3]MDV7102906.1 oligosaccharide flippase family protein [Vibrio sp. TH_r3]